MKNTQKIDVKKSPSDKVVYVDYLYLDLTVCTRCCGSLDVLKGTILKMSPAFELAGYSIRLNEIEISDVSKAEQYHFLSSPTIRVNGYDICGDIEENDCGCCSDISGTDVTCRIFRYNGETSEVVPEGMIAEGILRYALCKYNSEETTYELPQNLKEFFAEKESNIPLIRRCC